MYPPNYTRTTYSQRQLYFPNLIEGLQINDINKVLQTDITYYHLGSKVYYLVFIIDIYSRKIVGYATSKTLKAEGNINALKMFLRNRKGCVIKGAIHHSDKGGQHIDQDYRKLLKDNEIEMSMCGQAWENAYTERINRTIKDEYLRGWKIKDYEQLRRAVSKAVTHYNIKRRHQSLNWQTPVQFEEYIKTLPLDDRPKVKIYKQIDRNL